MPRRLLRCLTTGAGGRGDKRQNDTQQEYPPRVAQEHVHSSVPPPGGPVRVFAPLLPPGPIFGVQFISGALLLTNLLVPLATVRLAKPSPFVDGRQLLPNPVTSCLLVIRRECCWRGVSAIRVDAACSGLAHRWTHCSDQPDNSPN